ncbi:MAG: NUDIX domain-containing protein [Candidatus Saccharimonadales bacterium]
MRRAVRAIIIHNNQLVVMHRNKFGTEYDTLPGGNIEIGETPEQALRREITRETQLTIDRPCLVFLEHAGDPYGDQYIYYCEYVRGEPSLHPDAEETAINQLGHNLYQPRWLNLDQLPSQPFVSEKLKRAILIGITTGWPTTTTEL